MKTLKPIAVSIIMVAVSSWSLAAWAESNAQKPSFISIKSSEIKWTDAPSIAPGAKIAVLEGDLKAEGPIMFRLMVPAESKFDVHTHPTVERVTVISGSVHFAIGDQFDTEKTEEYMPGDAFIVPADTPMYGFTKQETVFQIQGDGPWGIHFLHSEDAHKKQ